MLLVPSSSADSAIARFERQNISAALLSQGAGTERSAAPNPPRAEHFQPKNRRYLGCKQRLLPFIDESLAKAGVQFESLIDGFAGTGVVGQYFADQGKSVIFNDILLSNYVSLNAFSGSQRIRKGLLAREIYGWAALEGEPGYFTRAYAGKYFSETVCKQIDAIRQRIDLVAESASLNRREFNYLLTALMYAVDKAANTCGHYDAFRASAPEVSALDLRPLLVSNNRRCRQFNLDVMELAATVDADLAYLDPPYNSRQYSSCYHVLENIAGGGGFEVSGKGAKPNLASKKSRWCTNDALGELKQLLAVLNVKHIAVSYNNMFAKGDGRSAVRIGYDDLYSALAEHGTVQVFETDHSVFSTGKSAIANHKELLFVCSR